VDSEVSNQPFGDSETLQGCCATSIVPYSMHLGVPEMKWTDSWMQFTQHEPLLCDLHRNESQHAVISGFAALELLLQGCQQAQEAPPYVL
jgi:hypothetical protein